MSKNKNSKKKKRTVSFHTCKYCGKKLYDEDSIAQNCGDVCKNKYKNLRSVFDSDLFIHILITFD
jgi:hypothetical protein